VLHSEISLKQPLVVAVALGRTNRASLMRERLCNSQSDLRSYFTRRSSAWRSRESLLDKTKNASWAHAVDGLRAPAGGSAARLVLTEGIRSDEVNPRKQEFIPKE